jgi:hypothetical protein
MASVDPIKKAVKSEKKRLNEQNELKEELNKYEQDLVDSKPSRVRVEKGKELIIEPPSLIDSFTSIKFFSVLGYSLGIGVAIYALLGMFLSAIISRVGVSNIQAGRIGTTISLIVALVFVFDNLKDHYQEVNSPFHLAVSGKNFMAHHGNPEEYMAASTKFDSDGEWNIMAEIEEDRHRVDFTWVYGPDINTSNAGGKGFKNLNLKDITEIRKFLHDNMIKIEFDRRIGE